MASSRSPRTTATTSSAEPAVPLGSDDSTDSARPNDRTRKPRGTTSGSGARETTSGSGNGKSRKGRAGASGSGNGEQRSTAASKSSVATAALIEEEPLAGAPPVEAPPAEPRPAESPPADDPFADDPFADDPFADDPFADDPLADFETLAQQLDELDRADGYVELDDLSDDDADARAATATQRDGPAVAPPHRMLARRRTHIVRHVSPWSVFKVFLLFYLCLWLVVLVAGSVLWQVGEQSGLVENAERFWAEATGQESVSWDGRALLNAAGAAGGIMAVAATGFTVLAAVLFNGISDLTGGIRLRVLEVAPPSAQPRQRKGLLRRSIDRVRRRGSGERAGPARSSSRR